MTALPCSGVKNGVGSRHAYLSGKARTVLCFSCMKQIFSHARVTTSRGPQCLYYRRPEQRWRATTPLLPMPPNPTRPQVRRHGLGERATARRSTLPQGPHQGSAATATAAAYDAADADAADAAVSKEGIDAPVVAVADMSVPRILAEGALLGPLGDVGTVAGALRGKIGENLREMAAARYVGASDGGGGNSRCPCCCCCCWCCEYMLYFCVRLTRPGAIEPFFSVVFFSFLLPFVWLFFFCFAMYLYHGRCKPGLTSLLFALPFDAVIHLLENPPHTRFLVGCSSSFMRLAERITALRPWC